MASKTERLKARARATVRTPKPPALLAGPQKRGYKVVAISLYTDQLEAVDHAARDLQGAGYRKANRSMVIQRAIHRLSADLQGKTRDELLRYFTEHDQAQAS